jgi:hypothetical protein
MSGARGERTLSVSGREIQVLFTNRALMTAENQLKRGILGVLQGFMDGSSGYTDLVTLLRVGMEAARVDARAGGKPVSNSDALDVLDALGFTAVASPVMEALSAVIGYTGEAESEEDPNL